MSTGQARSGAGEQWLPVDQALALAQRHRQEGRPGAAEELCRQLLRAQPRNAEALHLLGILAHQKGETAAAIDLIKQAIASNGSVPLYHCNLGEMCRLSGRLTEAISAGQRALELQPNYPQALNNLGIAQYDREDYEAAAECYRRALALEPGFAEAQSNLGNALRAQKKLDEAIAAYHRALHLRPGYADAAANLGSTLHLHGKLDEAIATYWRALALDPLQANAHAGLGLLMLTRGNFDEGWFEYEWRLRSGEMRDAARPPGLPWEGERLDGRRILVHSEQGLGDAIQFCRYLPMVRDRGGHVIFRVAAPLASLISHSMPWLELAAESRRELPPHDCHCPLLSLPLRFRTRMETIPASIPYLRASEDADRRWASRIGGGPELKVGLVWAGNPKHTNDFNRSIPIEALRPLFEIEGARFFSLQVGHRREQLAQAFRGKVTDLAEGLRDFMETAGAVNALDLVVTSDTAVAHLAGALGRPVWLLLPWVADWRWQLERTDSPWYPTMRLMRAKAREDWAPVIAGVMAELSAVIRGDRARMLPSGTER